MSDNAGARGSRAWAFKSTTSQYDDVLGAQYAYDSNVANSRQVQVGDLIVVHNQSRVLGTSTITSIDVSEEWPKRRDICPRCKGPLNPGKNRRKVAKPAWRCSSCNHEFDTPENDHVLVTRFIANYRDEWRAADEKFTLAVLKSALAKNANPQNSIRELDRAKIPVANTPTATETPHPSITGGYRATPGRTRIGQESFRRELINIYGTNCAVTGPCPEGSLEAAHLDRYADHQTHDVTAALLLRADIHRLIDRGLIRINPESRSVEIDDSLRSFPTYAGIAGVKITQPASSESLRRLAQSHIQAPSQSEDRGTN